MEVFLSILHSLFVIVPHMKEKFSKKLGRQVWKFGGRQVLGVFKESIICGQYVYIITQSQYPHSAQCSVEENTIQQRYWKLSFQFIDTSLRMSRRFQFRAHNTRLPTLPSSPQTSQGVQHLWLLSAECQKYPKLLWHLKNVPTYFQMPSRGVVALCESYCLTVHSSAFWNGTPLALDSVSLLQASSHLFTFSSH